MTGHTVHVTWNPDGSVDCVVLSRRDDDPWPHQRALMTLEDLGNGEWDLHVGPLHLSLGKRGLVIDAPAGLERPRG